MKGKTVLVTGATGFIGGSLAQKLIKKGARLRILVRDRNKASELRSWVLNSISWIWQSQVANAALTDCEYVFHCAAVLNAFSHEDCFRLVNIEGTRALATSAMRVGVKRFIHVRLFGLTA